ncbi:MULTISPECIES: hypothetical protein [unclassified Bradyrhizobium]
MIDDKLQFTGSGDRNLDRAILRQAEAGDLTRIAEGIYRRLEGRTVEEFVYAHWHRILAKLIPNAVLTGRTALSVNPW